MAGARQVCVSPWDTSRRFWVAGWRVVLVIVGYKSLGCWRGCVDRLTAMRPGWYVLEDLQSDNASLVQCWSGVEDCELAPVPLRVWSEKIWLLIVWCSADSEEWGRRVYLLSSHPRISSGIKKSLGFCFCCAVVAQYRSAREVMYRSGLAKRETNQHFLTLWVTSVSDMSTNTALICWCTVS